MPLHSKIEAAVALIRQSLHLAKAPVVLWSGGKDSQVLLWLVRQVLIDVQLVYFRLHEDARKEAFVHEMSARLPLQILQPFARDVAASGTHVELLNFFRVGDVAFHVGMQSGRPGSQVICLVEKFLSPLSHDRAECDVAFIGHKDCDVDNLYGQAILAGDVVRSGNTALVYPLRQWSDDDIWEASETYRIPQNWRRYDRRTKQKLDNDVWNNDYYSLCSNCCAPGLTVDLVDCPRIGKTAYLGDLLPLNENFQLYRDNFLNVTGYEKHTPASHSGHGERIVGSGSD